MYRLLAFVLMVCLAGTAMAADLGNKAPTQMDKPAPQVYVPPAVPLQGGDTIASATVIPGLPYNNTGTTSGYVNDYDEICPYSGSTSPDVVYSYTPAANVAVDVDLCYSTYDTKVYVYDSGLSLVACNDDFYFGPPCGTYVSKLENVALNAGMTYYIVIDGYGGDFGNYELAIIPYEPCELPCPNCWVLEGEPPIVDGYVDNYNGGCNSTPYVFQTYDWINENGVGPLCGKSGTYIAPGGGSYRDTDWFEVFAAGGTMTFTVDAEFAVNMFVLNCDCGNIQLLEQCSAGPCLPCTITWDATAGTCYWLWVGPTVFSGLPEFNYLMEVTGHLYTTIATEQTTWGSLKDLYK